MIDSQWERRAACTQLVGESWFKNNRFSENLRPSCSEKVWVFSSSLYELEVLVPSALVLHTLLVTCSSAVAGT